MEIIRKISKPAAIFLALHMLMLSGLSQSVTAAMIGTESIIKVDRGQNPRDYLNNLLARKEIQAALISQGIDPQEAQDRIINLSDDEIGKFVQEMDQLHAGGGFLETFIVIVFLIFLILLVTDISGYTDVFPFVKKHASKKITRDDTTIETANIKKIQPSLEDNGISPADNLIIYFKPDSNDLTAKAIESLDRVVKFMAKNSKTRINIIGFSDSTVSSSYNVMLSESRANTVKSYLIAKGIDSKKISSLGLGSEGFSATEGTEEERQMIGGVAIEFNKPTTK
ncbi:MAG: PA2779 family protein [Desulfobacterales bacterium]|nr:PA2779 family protein [Desulfobacterales bacterium]